MAILVTGSTGVVGQQVIEHLNGSGADVRALTRSPEKAQFPAGERAERIEAGRSAHGQGSGEPGHAGRRRRIGFGVRW